MDREMNWYPIPEVDQEEIMSRLLDLVASCDHRWSGWPWLEGNWSKQCAVCSIRVFDVANNAAR
jgi:hypothetical protein